MDLSMYLPLKVTVAVLAVSLLLSPGIFNLQSDLVQAAEPQHLTYTLSFPEPSLTRKTIGMETFTEVSLAGAFTAGIEEGAPLLPRSCVQLVLPASTMVDEVTVTGESILVDMPLHDLHLYPIIPYQPPEPIGYHIQQDLIMDTALYEQDSMYPSSLFQEQLLGYCRGYPILSVTVNPVHYNPLQGTLRYYSEINIEISLQTTDTVHPFLRDTSIDAWWVKQLVSNPETISTYHHFRDGNEYPGGLCDPADHYEYVIITTERNNLDHWNPTPNIPNNWNTLMNHHLNINGLACTLVTIEDINQHLDYELPDPYFDDLPGRVREFCKDAYLDWGTEYILIGGDDEWIPAREMDYQYEGNVDSDLYWSNLDNTFNDDHDIFWGEYGDTGFDLYSELFIGRITCDEPKDVSNWIEKSIQYATTTDVDVLDNAAFYGGNTGWIAQGDDFIDYSAIKGTDNWLGWNDSPYPNWLGFQFGFETWNEYHQDHSYDLSVKWTAESKNPGWHGGSLSSAVLGLKNSINDNQVTLLSAIAHANAWMSMDVYCNEDWAPYYYHGLTYWEESYHNTRPFFVHDYGCHCGDMDAAADGVLHSMLFHSDTNLAFACVYNTCYGWGNYYCTNSSSAVLQKSFWDYLFDLDNNSGTTMNWQLGKAHAWSKDHLAPTINWGSHGTWRGVIQGCLLFGDPAQSIKPPGDNQLCGDVYDGHGGPLFPGPPYQITCDIVVPYDHMLTAHPGVILRINPNMVLTTQGVFTLSATGADPANIYWEDSLYQLKLKRGTLRFSNNVSLKGP
jgi:hypothetical protein